MYTLKKLFITTFLPRFFHLFLSLDPFLSVFLSLCFVRPVCLSICVYVCVIVVYGKNRSSFSYCYHDYYLFVICYFACCSFGRCFCQLKRFCFVFFVVVVIVVVGFCMFQTFSFVCDSIVACGQSTRARTLSHNAPLIGQYNNIHSLVVCACECDFFYTLCQQNQLYSV